MSSKTSNHTFYYYNEDTFYYYNEGYYNKGRNIYEVKYNPDPRYQVPELIYTIPLKHYIEHHIQSFLNKAHNKFTNLKYTTYDIVDTIRSEVKYHGNNTFYRVQYEIGNFVDKTINKVEHTVDTIKNSKEYKQISSFVKHQYFPLLAAVCVIPYTTLKVELSKAAEIFCINKIPAYENLLKSTFNLNTRDELLQYMQDQYSMALKITLGISVVVAVGCIATAIILEVLDNNERASDRVAYYNF